MRWDPKWGGNLNEVGSNKSVVQNVIIYELIFAEVAQ